MFSTSAAAVTVLCLTGALIVTSSSWTYFTKRLSIGETAAISFTTIENRVGPNTVPWGTLLLMTTNAVTALSTTTLCFRLSRKLIIQLIICGLMFVDFSLSQIILWDTVSNGLLQSKDNKRIKSESRSNADGQKCWHFKRPRVVLHPSLNPNWSLLMIDLNSVDISCLNISLSKSLIIMLVREISESCVHSFFCNQHAFFNFGKEIQKRA